MITTRFPRLYYPKSGGGPSSSSILLALLSRTIYNSCYCTSTTTISSTSSSVGRLWVYSSWSSRFAFGFNKTSRGVPFRKYHCTITKGGTADTSSSTRTRRGMTLTHSEIVSSLPERFVKAREAGDLLFFPSTVHIHEEHGVQVSEFFWFSCLTKLSYF